MFVTLYLSRCNLFRPPWNSPRSWGLTSVNVNLSCWKKARYVTVLFNNWVMLFTVKWKASSILYCMGGIFICHCIDLWWFMGNSTSRQITPEGNILDVQFFKSVIHSVASLTYDQAQNILDNPHDYSTYSKNIVDSVNNLNVLAKYFRERRIEQGDLSFRNFYLSNICFGCLLFRRTDVGVSRSEIQVWWGLIEPFRCHSLPTQGIKRIGWRVDVTS